MSASSRNEYRRNRYRSKIATDKVTVWCDYCKTDHEALRLTYDRNIKKNGTYICERYGGHLAGSRSKEHLKKTNPHAAEGKKVCTACSELRVLETDFDKREASWDGYAASCKECVSTANKRRYAAKKLEQRNQE